MVNLKTKEFSELSIQLIQLMLTNELDQVIQLQQQLLRTKRFLEIMKKAYKSVRKEVLESYLEYRISVFLTCIVITRSPIDGDLKTIIVPCDKIRKTMEGNWERLNKLQTTIENYVKEKFECFENEVNKLRELTEQA